MTYTQQQWAAQHDWYRSADLLADGSYRIWVRSNRPEGGILPFSDFQRLRNWAGY